jgi:hypothetical protein
MCFYVLGTLSKSNELFATFKNEMEKMSKTMKKMEKEKLGKHLYIHIRSLIYKLFYFILFFFSDLVFFFNVFLSFV